MVLITTEIFFLALVKYFLHEIAWDTALPFSFVAVVFWFVMYRFVTDWEKFDTTVENELRYLMISDHYSHRLLFAAYGGIIITIAHPQLLDINLFKTFVIGTSAVVLSNTVFEMARIAVNRITLGTGFFKKKSFFEKTRRMN